jgi:hypothetical protein
MAGTLYTYPESFRANKVLIAAQYSGAAVKVVCDPPQFELGVTNHSHEFLAKFPLGKVRYTHEKHQSADDSMSHAHWPCPTRRSFMGLKDWLY